MASSDLTASHVGLSDAEAAQRYFTKFDRILGHLGRVAGAMRDAGDLTREEQRALAPYLEGLARSLHALSVKYLLTGRETGSWLGSLTMDRQESGFPVYQEILTLAIDAAQADRHLAGMASSATMKDEMIRTIVGEHEVPRRLQFALSQRLYYEALAEGGLFWARNDPDLRWLGEDNGRRRFLVHWAVYDSQENLPTVYLMELEDSGRVSLPKDERRWPAVQAHLSAQAVAGLKLVTIAQGFDADFDDLHPKRLRRFRLGPMYSSAYTLQTGPICAVLREAQSGPGDDWALAWSSEELVSDRVREERAGWFGTVEREVYRLDPFGGRGAETGVTRLDRAVILPQRPYQVLAERRPPGFSDVAKFVVSPGGRVFATR